MGLNPLTLGQENTDATPELVEKLNLLDRLTIFNFLNKINSQLNDNFTSLLNPYSIEINSITEPLIDTVILGCTDSNANNFVEGANTDDGSCDYNFNIGLQIVEQGENLNFYPKFIDGGLSTNESETITNDKGEEIVVEGEFFYEADILNGENAAKTIDGRRIYTFKQNESEDGNIILKIENYTNIWADHKRNDLKKIEFFIEDDFLPYEIFIHFKERVFRLERI